MSAHDESSPTPPEPAPTPTSTVTLRAHDARPLADDRTAATVEAVAHAIAERTGVPLLDLASAPDRITVTLAAPRLAAIGFAAELRRLTNRWHTDKHDSPLWRDPETPDDPFEDLAAPPEL